MMSVRDGEITNIAPLFERHSSKLFNYYVRLTGDRQLSEDMVQDVFLRIMTYRHTFRGESQFTTWMFSIARNVQIDNARRWNREQPFRYDEETGYHEEPVAGETSDHRYDTQLLREAILGLTPAKREALILSRYEGMKYAEIAELTGSTVESVKVRIHRAVNDLRKHFAERGGAGKPPGPRSPEGRNTDGSAGRGLRSETKR